MDTMTNPTFPFFQLFHIHKGNGAIYIRKWIDQLSADRRKIFYLLLYFMVTSTFRHLEVP